ncbi:hypothetical protein R1flu_020102 [Riccia fluitans]|uniref:5'-3' exonuclease domain-containing protein n=1 Tax=Riccia fluitans TaxID=41844 RepID=A0ABD1ZKK9_9MARC
METERQPEDNREAAEGDWRAGTLAGEKKKVYRQDGARATLPPAAGLSVGFERLQCRKNGSWNHSTGCLLGDSSDNVPGLPELAPGFGRKTALKLMKKHGSLENLLVAAKTRTVGRPYIQEALTQHADVLYRNLQVLKLRRDVDIILKDEWCRPRDRSNEAEAFQILENNLLRKTVS